MLTNAIWTRACVRHDRDNGKIQCEWNISARCVVRVQANSAVQRATRHDIQFCSINCFVVMCQRTWYIIHSLHFAERMQSCRAFLLIVLVPLLFGFCPFQFLFDFCSCARHTATHTANDMVEHTTIERCDVNSKARSSTNRINDYHLSAHRVLSRSMPCRSTVSGLVGGVSECDRRIRVTPSVDDICCNIFYFQYRHEYKRKSQTVRRKQLIPLISIDSTRAFSCIVLFLLLRIFVQNSRNFIAVQLFYGRIFFFAISSASRMRHSCWPTIWCLPLRAAPRICVFHSNIDDK